METAVTTDAVRQKYEEVDDGIYITTVSQLTSTLNITITITITITNTITTLL